MGSRICGPGRSSHWWKTISNSHSICILIYFIFYQSSIVWYDLWRNKIIRSQQLSSICSSYLRAEACQSRQRRTSLLKLFGIRMPIGPFKQVFVHRHGLDYSDVEPYCRTAIYEATVSTSRPRNGLLRQLNPWLHTLIDGLSHSRLFQRNRI